MAPEGWFCALRSISLPYLIVEMPQWETFRNSIFTSGFAAFFYPLNATTILPSISLRCFVCICPSGSTFSCKVKSQVLFLFIAAMVGKDEVYQSAGLRRPASMNSSIASSKRGDSKLSVRRPFKVYSSFLRSVH